MQRIACGILAIWVIAGFVYRRQRFARPHNPPTEGVDPGWGPVFARATQLFPYRSKASAAAADPLSVMRLIFVGLVSALFLYIVAFSFSTPWNSGSEGAAPWIVIAVGLLSLVGIAWVRRRPFNVQDETSLPGVFRTLMFLGIGIGEVPALFALVMMFVTKSLWVYLIGLAFSLLDLWLIGPTKTEIARRQRQLVEAHLPHDLTRALMTPPERPPTL